MQDQIITPETSRLAESKGFDRYKVQEPIMIPNEEGGQSEYYPSVTQTLIQRWLREVKGVIVWIEFTFYDGWHIINHAARPDGKHVQSDREFNSYEEALEAGLQEGLGLLS